MSNYFGFFRPMEDTCTNGHYSITLNKEIDPTYAITSEFEKGLYSALDNRNTFQEFMAKMSIVQNKQLMHNSIKKVIFNNPATIVIWVDGSKTVVKCDDEKYDPEKGLAMAICKRLLGNNQGYYYEVFKKWLPKKINVKKLMEGARSGRITY